MGYNRYAKRTFIQPVRRIQIRITDIEHTMSQFDNVDMLAYKYYSDATLGWIIMCGNPEQTNEFEIQPGTKLRIPFPLDAVFNDWGITNEL